MPLKVLVIDNNAAEATLVNTALGAEGYDVATASSLGEGLTVFRQTNADLLLIATDLPEVSTWWDQAHDTLADVPVILIGDSDATVPAAATLGSPIDTSELLATVRAQVGGAIAPETLAWLPDALRQSDAEMSEVERLLGWRAGTDGAEDKDPVSLGIFTESEAGTPAQPPVADHADDATPSLTLPEAEAPPELDDALTAVDRLQGHVTEEDSTTFTLAREVFGANRPDKIDTVDESGASDLAITDDTGTADPVAEPTESGATTGEAPAALNPKVETPDPATEETETDIPTAPTGQEIEASATLPPPADTVPDTAPATPAAPESHGENDAGDEAMDNTGDRVIAATEAAGIHPPDAAPTGDDFANSRDSDLMSEIDAAFAAFDDPAGGSTDSLDEIDDTDEANETIAEDLMADELIAETITEPEDDTANTGEIPPETGAVRETGTVTETNVTPETAQSIAATPPPFEEINLETDAVPKTGAVPETDVTPEAPEPAIPMAADGPTDQDTISEPIDEVQDLMDTLSGLLDDDDLLGAPTIETNAEDAPVTPSEPPTWLVGSADVLASDAGDAPPEPPIEPQAIELIDTTASAPRTGENVLAAAGVSETGDVPLSSTPPPQAPLGTGAPLVTNVVPEGTRDIAGVPIEKVERIIADVAREVVERVVWETVPALVAKALSDTSANGEQPFAKILERAVWDTVPALAKARVNAEIERLAQD